MPTAISRTIRMTYTISQWQNIVFNFTTHFAYNCLRNCRAQGIKQKLLQNITGRFYFMLELFELLSGSSYKQYISVSIQQIGSNNCTGM